MARSQRRTTSWTFVCYPESLPADYERRFANMHIPLAYILHSMDTEPCGTRIKDHIHVLLKYDSVKAYDQVADDFEWTGITFIEPVRSFHAMTRYLVHLDDPDKYQYSQDSVKSVSGLALDFSRHFTPDEQVTMMQEITAFIEDNDVTSFEALWSYCARHERNWLSLLMNKTSYSVNQFIKSRNARIFS